MEKKQISLQVYSARNFKPYEDIFKYLSEEEMKNVELFEVEAFNETKEFLDKYNLTSLSTLSFSLPSLYFNKTEVYKSSLGLVKENSWDMGLVATVVAPPVIVLWPTLTILFRLPAG